MLVINPFATATSESGRETLIHTLSSAMDVTAEFTTHRNHAGELAARARAQGYDLVIAHGGDGTVNEVVNGLLDPPDSGPTVDKVPALAVIPGGSANVFARSLGIDPEPLRATASLMNLVSSNSRRRISLGHTENRWFLFNTGMGIDGEVVKSLELQRNAGASATVTRYVTTTVAKMLSGMGSSPSLRVEVNDAPAVGGCYFCFVSNASPWTYLGPMPVTTNPGCGYDSGLGVFAVRSMNFLRNLDLSRQLLTNRNGPRARHVLRHDNVAKVRVVADEPVEIQMDGEHLGTRTELVFRFQPSAIEVVAPNR